MKRSYTRKTLIILLFALFFALVSIGAFARVHVRRAAARADVAKSGQSAPSFNVRTLEGVAYNNTSLNGSPILLQFWTARCKDCREDQAAVDEIDSKFVGQGLVVLAINEGDSAKTVNNFLREHPRTVRIVLDERKQIAGRFGKHGTPYYVLIDRQGRIAGTQRGSAGQHGLTSLLKRVGLQERRPAQASEMHKAKILDVAQDRSPKETKDTKKGAEPETKTDEKQGASDQKQAGDGKQAPGNKEGADSKAGTEGKPGEQAAAAEEPPKPSGMKMIEIPAEKQSHAGPLPRAVFILTNGERLEADRYTMDTKYIHVALEGEERIIAMSAVDVKATESANHARGVDLKLPTSKSEVFVSF